MKLEKGYRVLFQGDSITNAFRKPEEYNDLFQLGAGFAMLIAARIRFQRPDDRIIFTNRGISGNNIVDLLARWRPECLDLRPDVLNILIGANDSLGMGSVAIWGQQYRRLLEITRAELPAVRLVLCEPFLLPCGGVREDQLQNMAERQSEFRRIAREQDAVVVLFNEAFAQALHRAPADYWVYDGIHPTAAGAELMAQTWLDTVSLT